MEETDRSVETQENLDIPKLPIKTYHWEDVRRARKRGAYPWTHLTKPPFHEFIDPDEYTMEAFRRSRSTSTIGKSETQEIPELDEDIDITPENKENIPASGSQHLKITKPLQLKPPQNGNGNGQRAKSEEPKKKRKLSIESSHSRISSSTFNFFNKFTKGKSKIGKPPKRSKSDAADSKKPIKRIDKLPVGKNVSPVYIHIPLKPPPGEMDEFSKLEFESPSHSPMGSLKNILVPPPTERKMSLLGLLTQIKIAHEQNVQTKVGKKPSKPDTALSKRIKLHASSSEEEDPEKGIVTHPVTPELDSRSLIEKPKDTITFQTTQRLQIEELLDDDKKSNKSTEDSKPESERVHKPKTPEPLVLEPEDSSADDNISQYLDKDDKDERTDSRNISTESISQPSISKIEEPSVLPPQPQETKPNPDQVKKIEATLSKWKKQMPAAQSLAPPAQQAPLRARSEEPKRKRRSSIDSGYSRKSLSKLGFLKRLKEIKLPKLPSFSKADKKEQKPVEAKVDKITAITKLEVKKPQAPVYIHIPLKPPLGETDEFSYLENEPREDVKIEEVKAEKEEDSVPASPDSPKDKVHLIFLTSPSDDEILDSPLPETPSEGDQRSLDSLKLEDLKTLAKKAMDTVYPEPKKLETVIEDDASDKQDVSEADEALIIENQPEPKETKSEEQIQIKKAIEPEENTKTKKTIELEENAETKDMAEPKEKISKNKKKSKAKRKAKGELVEAAEEPKGTNVDEPSVEIKPEVLEPKSEKETPEEISKMKELLFQKHSLVDEEDGLQLSDAAIAMINEEIEKELKEQTESQELKPSIKSEGSPPTMKKKVSFKRRSKADDGERIYEDVELNVEEPKNNERPLESFQSMSVDEEKSYLERKVIKTTSLEEDYNKWSKLNDHDYEPVNPPPEEISIKGSPVSTMKTETTPIQTHFVKIPSPNELIIQEDIHTPDDNLDEPLSMQEVQDRIEDHFFNKPPPKLSTPEPPKPQPKQKSASPTVQKKEVPKPKSSDKSFNDTLRLQADKLKTKLKGIKRPSFTLPQRPKIKKPNIKKPSFTMPQRPSIQLPSFNLTRKSSKDSWRERQFSTESNVSTGDSKKKFFDFRTYPRIFDKAKKNKNEESTSEFATVPRTKKAKQSYEDSKLAKESPVGGIRRDVIRIPLHSDNEDEPMDVPSHTRYNEDIDIEDDFNREPQEFEEDEDNRERAPPPFNAEYLKRWEHGEFHQGPTEEDNLRMPAQDSFDAEVSPAKEELSSGSISEHRRGVLEEIDSDEFFLREKGISQDNIEVGQYLSSEIREAFRNPINALSQLQSEDREYELDNSDQSEPIQHVPRKKPLKKPKRKKTPHVSREQISFDSVASEPEEYPKPFDDFKMFTPPARPKRKSKKNKKKKPTYENEDVVPYQETISITEQIDVPPVDDYEEYHEESMEIIGISPNNILSEFYDKELSPTYENEHMQGIEQPEIKVCGSYYGYENFPQDVEPYLEERPPVAPSRKQRSLKSLTTSEQDSYIDDIHAQEILEQNMDSYRGEHEYIIPTPEPPVRPSRTRSRTRSRSRVSAPEEDIISRGDESLISEQPSEAMEEYLHHTTHIDSSFPELSPTNINEFYRSQYQEPAVEEVCVQDARDASGYAVIDKSRIREPPLPPSRHPKTPPRTRRGKKFATVPRPPRPDVPVRPQRNYSTLRDSLKSRSTTPFNDQNKENIIVSQYIEIDDEPVQHLQSGEVIQKMKDRPLPPPPRPPRRPRSSTREIFRDISHERNLPDDFEDEEKFDDGDSKIQEDIEQQIIPYEMEETITHASLVVQPINDAQILPRSQLSNVEHTERIIPISYDDEYEETSEIPEEFLKLKDPQVPPKTEEDTSELLENNDYDETSEIPDEFFKLTDPVADEKIEKEPLQDQQEAGILRAQKLQVIDLDVDRLRVNELQASKIVVSELDGVSLQVSEINSKSGNIVLSGIELPPHFVQDMLNRLQSAAQDQIPSSLAQSSEATTQTLRSESPKDGQKKTSIEERLLEENNFSDEEGPPVPPRYDSQSDLLEESLEQPLTQLKCLKINEAPIRPPRRSSQPEKLRQSSEEASETPIVEESNEQPSIPFTKDSEIMIQDEPEALSFKSQVEISLQQTPLSEKSESSLISNLVISKESQEENDSFEIKSSMKEIPGSDEIESRKSEEPPPRPPQPVLSPTSDYVPSQPPASFYALRSPGYGDFIDEDIPLPPRRKRHHKAPPISRSSSDDVPPTPRKHRQSSEQSIPHLTGQLVRACANETERSIRRLISHFLNNVLNNADGRQDLHVMILMLLLLIAGLILLGNDATVIHHYHWDFFNPPGNL